MLRALSRRAVMMTPAAQIAARRHIWMAGAPVTPARDPIARFASQRAHAPAYSPYG